MISKYLEALKSKRKLTNKQIAEMSGVSPATIQRVLAEKGESSFDTVLRIVRGLGGSLDEMAGISKPESQELQELREKIAEQSRTIETLEQRIANFDTNLDMISKSYQDALADRERGITYLRRITRILSVSLAVLVLFIMLVMAIDLLNGHIGWHRY